MPWFAGNMERPMAEDTLMDAPDGTFLVRVSQSRAGYSLTVKYLEIRHVVIVESNNKFGFSEPTTFDTLPVGSWPKKRKASRISRRHN